jgi:hypothetical protein
MCGRGGPEYLSMSKSRPARTAIVAVLLTASALSSAFSMGTARAYSRDSFKSPSGNINCSVGEGLSGTGNEISAECDIAEHTWTPPARTGDCLGPNAGSQSRFVLEQGKPAALICHSDSLVDGTAAVLQFGQSRSLKSISCTSGPDGMTCRDSSSGHYFRVAKESYELH